MPLRPLSWSREPAARPSSTARTRSVSPTVLSRAVWPKEDGEGGRDEDSPEPATRPPVAQRARVAGRLPYVHAILCPVACLVGLQHRKFLTGHPLPARRRAQPAPCNASAGCATATAPATASYQQSLLVCQVSWCSCPCVGRTRPGRRACAMRKVCTHPLCATGNVLGHTTPAVSDVGGASVRLKFRADTGRSRDAGDIEAGGWLLALSRRGGAAHGGVLPAIAAVPGENGMDRFMQSRQGLAECVVMARPILCPQVSVIASSPHTGC